MLYFILLFLGVSIVASIFAVAACMVSSRVSQSEAYMEIYEAEAVPAEKGRKATSPST